MGACGGGAGEEPETLSLAPELVEEAAAVLAEAFKTEEVTAYYLDMSRPSTMRRTRMMDGLFLQLYLEAGRPVIAATRDGRLVGVGMVRDPRMPIPKWRALALILPNLFQLMALFANRPLRLMRVLRATKHPKGLSKPYFTFEVLGVHPDHQGKGAGRALMRMAQVLAEENHAVSGIYLNTGSEKNQSFYRSMGYDTLRVVDLGQVKVYHMFWKNPAFGEAPRRKD